MLNRKALSEASPPKTEDWTAAPRPVHPHGLSDRLRRAGAALRRARATSAVTPGRCWPSRARSASGSSPRCSAARPPGGRPGACGSTWSSGRSSSGGRWGCCSRPSRRWRSSSRPLLHAPLNAAWTAGLGAALIGTLMAFFSRPRLREHEIEIAGLPAAVRRLPRGADLRSALRPVRRRRARRSLGRRGQPPGGRSGGGHRRPDRQRLDLRAGRRDVARQAARPRRGLRLHGQPRLLHRRGRDGARRSSRRG